MNSNNHHSQDENLSADAQETWQSLESDRLGQAIQQSLDRNTSPANPELRALLTERLTQDDQVTPANAAQPMIGKESKLAKPEKPGASWKWLKLGAAISMISACLMLFLVPNLLQYEPALSMSEDSTALPASGNAFGSGGAPNDGARNKSENKSESTPRFIPSPAKDRPVGPSIGGDGPADADGGLYSVRPTGKLPAQPPSSGRSAKEFPMPSPIPSPIPSPQPEGAQPNETLEDGNADADRQRDGAQDSEQYDPIYENQFIQPQGEAALSTFSIDVDTAAYANVRRFLSAGQRPPSNAVRIEELINYFSYDYPQPTDDRPFSVNMEVAGCPWQPGHQLIRIGLKGKQIQRDERPVSNLVFLLDVSGSMNNSDKLPLLKRGLRMMIDQLNENDRISIVTYAGNAGVVLEPTSGDQKKQIIQAIEDLSSGGSTHGSAGIEKAYDLAKLNFVDGGVNRVIWATDGDLNVGVTEDTALINLVAERATEGVFLTTLGFGRGNLKDSKLEQVANHGNGVYYYIDSMREARKVLVEQMSGSLVTIAKDVKLQIEFNPAEVKAYRLIGYENRILATEDFDNDLKDAGEIGAGHTVTAIYEIVPTGSTSVHGGDTKLKYQQDADEAVQEESGNENLTEAAANNELLTLALRYKLPDANESTRFEVTLANADTQFDDASTDFRFAASVASFGMILRDSRFRGTATLNSVEEIALDALGDDKKGYRSEFLDLVHRAR